MKVTQVALCPSTASQQAGRPALTPELLAASGARYSRNNEGLEAILSKIDPLNLEKSVDSIFRMVDYGHQSIADMVPVAMFIDGISIWLAYYLWTLCPTAGGQESSTRYIRLSVDELIGPELLGIPQPDRAPWLQLMSQCFQAYHDSLRLWEDLALANPSLTGIPRSLLQDTSEASQKKVARMRRNYAFDRARYFIPVGTATNAMLIMSARGWVNVCQHLLSHPLPEPQRLGTMVRNELALAAPRMLKHACRTDAHQRCYASEFDKLVQLAKQKPPAFESIPALQPARVEVGQPYLTVMAPDSLGPSEVPEDLASHTNRYAPIGSGLQRIGVRFGWEAIGFAEIRDLNRHRTGTKYCPQAPRGFYFALDQLPEGTERQSAELLRQADIGRSATESAHTRLKHAEPSHVYWSVLGTEYPFEHLTSADRFIYEAELRTGLGAHFRYAKHLRDALALWYRRFPQTRGLILEGSAEPE